MRYLILFLLMTSAVLAVDSRRIGTHSVDENLTDTVDFVEYSYGDYANVTRAAISGYSDELDYIKTRAGPLTISRWSIMDATDYIAINVTGTYPGFAFKEGDKYRIDGKGFIDTLCSDYRYSYISPIDQEFEFDIIVPDSLTILSVPDNGSADLTTVVYNLTVTVSGNTVHRYTSFIVKNGTDIFTYCRERGNLDALLKKGIIAEKIVSLNNGGLPYIIATLVLLLGSLYYLVKK